MPERLTALCLRIGIDQIQQRLGLNQIELAVLHCPTGERAGLRRPRTRYPPDLIQQPLHDCAPAVDVEFHDVFPSETRRRGKPQHQRRIDRAAIPAGQRPQHGLARFRQRPG